MAIFDLKLPPKEVPLTQFVPKFVNDIVSVEKISKVDGANNPGVEEVEAFATAYAN
jgi:hypothetical protein